MTDDFYIIVYENSARKCNRRCVLNRYGTYTTVTAFFIDRNGPQKLPQTCSKQKSPERRRRPPIASDPKPVIKDTGAAAASRRRPTCRPRFQVPQQYIRAREGVGNRIPGKQAAPVSVPAFKPSHPATKSHGRQCSAKR